MPKPIHALVVSFCLAHASAFAQSHPTQATLITGEEVKEVLKGAPPKIDQQLKVVDVGPYNVGVAIVHWGKSVDPTDGTAPCILHHHLSETYIITSGAGTLVTGGTILNPKEVSKDDEIYRIDNGPTAMGTVRKAEAQVRQLKPGDIVIIPPEVCHGWVGISDHVDYIVVRPDPDRVLPAGYVDPAIRK